MFVTYGFETLGVVAGDMYFLDPVQKEGQEGAEHGVRLELRHVEARQPQGSVYAGVPIFLGRPVWRVDLFATLDAPAGTLDRAHHHPRLRGWEPDGRTFDPALSADPLGWLAGQLADPAAILDRAGVPAGEVTKADEEGLAAAAGDIVAAVGRMLDAVWAGDLGNAPADLSNGARNGWL